MGMAIGSRGPQINMTPLIDVLLVLLIIFLVITPSKSVGLNATAPQPASDDAPAARADTHIVILVRGGGLVEVNRHPMNVTELPAQLLSVYQGRPDGAVFLTAEKDLEFGEVAKVIDVVKGAGSYRIGLMPGNAR